MVMIIPPKYAVSAVVGKIDTYEQARGYLCIVTFGGAEVLIGSKYTKDMLIGWSLSPVTTNIPDRWHQEQTPSFHGVRVNITSYSSRPRIYTII